MPPNGASVYTDSLTHGYLRKPTHMRVRWTTVAVEGRVPVSTTASLVLKRVF